MAYEIDFSGGVTLSFNRTLDPARFLLAVLAPLAPILALLLRGPDAPCPGAPGAPAAATAAPAAAPPAPAAATAAPTTGHAAVRPDVTGAAWTHQWPIQDLSFAAAKARWLDPGADDDGDVPMFV
jgi:hypothetical protein